MQSPPDAQLTVPFCGWVKPVTLSGSPSVSLSLAIALTVTRLSSSTAVVVPLAIGGSLTGLTVILTVAGSEQIWGVPLSQAWYVKESGPL